MPVFLLVQRLLSTAFRRWPAWLCMIAYQGRINMGWKLSISGLETSHFSQSTFSSSSSLGYGESTDYLFNPYMGVCHCTRQKFYLERYQQIELVCFLRIRFCLPYVLSDNLRVWTSNTCARVFLLMEREAELWAAGAVRSFKSQTHFTPSSSWIVCPANSRTKQMWIIPQLKRIFTFSWYKSEQLQRRFFELRIWPLSHGPVITVDQ